MNLIMQYNMSQSTVTDNLKLIIFGRTHTICNAFKILRNEIMLTTVFAGMQFLNTPSTFA